MTYGTLLVGLGNIGMGYDLSDPARVLSHARAFGSHPRFRLVAAVDPDAARRAACEKAYKCPTYSDVESASAHRAELAVVAAPTSAHGDALRRVLALGPKAVLCEKPLAYEVSEARAMVRACAEGGAGLYVNYMRRSEPGALEVKRRFDAGEIAGAVKGVVWYTKGFLHNASHFFNLLELWLGPAKGGKVVDAGRPVPGPDAEPDVRVDFERGTVHFLAAREEDYPHHAVELVARNGRLRYERGGALIEWRPSDASGLSPTAEAIVSGMDRYQWHVADQLARALDGGDARLCTGAEALGTLERMKGILERT